jgi:hypothetical protein
MTDARHAELLDAARRLGQQHGHDGTTPFGQTGHEYGNAADNGYTSYVYWDEGSARLLDVLGDTGDTTAENHGPRAEVVSAYCTAYDEAREEKAHGPRDARPGGKG